MYVNIHTVNIVLSRMATQHLQQNGRDFMAS